MQFANIKQLNLILDIVLDFVMDCYILWNMKILLMIKLCIAIKKILNVYGINLLDFLFTKNALIIEYAEIKLFALRKDNDMMKKYIDKNNLKLLKSNLAEDLASPFEKRIKYEEQLAKIAKNTIEDKNQKAEETNNLNNRIN